MGSGTNIARAINQAIRDFEKETYDTADNMIITDGEDHAGLEVESVRAALSAARIRLHATLLGTNNETLRNCADSHVLIDEDLRIASMGRRK